MVSENDSIGRESEAAEADLAPLQYDGVAYALFGGPEISWRMGASCASWQQLLPPAPNPTAEDVRELARSGVYLAKARPASPLALMCQGMGGIWPGAGRELYDEFPAAREAMDRIQAVASWDVLSLLDENSMDRITATRWQIPYLFLLEYAQYAYLASLGLSPALLCGHSLGELMALCFAGIYTPEVAWHILDTRAEHVSVLESRASQDFGMLAVHAVYDVVREVLDSYPDVRVANYNTPSQFIVGGPKAVLKEIRGKLRKSRIPAVSISVSLLFHHPQMRVLRDHSLLRLNMLSMRAPSTPVISVSKLLLYPDDQSSICRFIADLDENPVRFSECLAAMWSTYGIRSYLEIGPSDILAGLIRENLPEATVMTAGRKGREAHAMRELCARLYALGHLSRRAIERSRFIFHDAMQRGAVSDDSERHDDRDSSPDRGMGEQDGEKVDREQAERLIALLSRLTGVGNVTLNCDLRADLALRSSSFPSLLKEAERLFSHTPSFEELLRVVTVGDLLRVFRGESLARPASLASRHCKKEPLVRLVRRGDVFVPASLARGVCSLGRLLVEIPGGGPEELLSLRCLLPDLLIGLPGLVSSVAFADNASFCRTLCEDTIGCALPFADGKDGVLPDCVLRILLPGRRSHDSDISLSGKHTVFLRVSDVPPKRGELLCGEPERGDVLVDLISPSHERRYHELGRLLALELSTLDLSTCFDGEPRHSLWIEKSLCGTVLCDTKERNTLPPQSVKEPLLSSLLVPDRVMNGSSVSRFSARVFYAATFDRKLEGLATLPHARALECMAYGAWVSAPWLRVLGFSDIEFSPMPGLFHAFPREGRVTATHCGWVDLCGVPTQQVESSLAMDSLLPNGRKSGQAGRIVACAVILGHDEIPSDRLSPAVHAVSEGKAGTPLAPWYEASGIPPAWRLLDVCLGSSGESLCLTLNRPSDAPSLVLGEETTYDFSQYAPYFLLFESAVQAAMYWLGMAGEEQGKSLFPASAGFVLFSKVTGGEACRLHISCTLHDENRKRFDVRITNNAGETLLTILQLQFEPALHAA